MNEIITINTTQRMTSLEIAEIMEKNHFHVLRDIEKLILEEAINAPRFGLVKYKYKKGEDRPMY
jgi:phage regulator Rha-like protein